ncbi:MAG: GTP-binding protein [Anaerolineae bacterium]
MKKTRLILVGGFLGAGKTTLLLQAAKYLTGQGLRVGLVTNDQGQNLVDTALVHQHEYPVQEVAGGCFCCNFPDLLEAVRRLQAEVQPDVILAEPVGSCTDLRATVVLPIQRFHADEYEVAPLTIMLDPLRDLGHFPSTVAYLYRQQLSEAEIIALNKADQLDEAAVREKTTVLENVYHEARVMSLSARTAAGVVGWIEQVMTATSRIERVLDIDYETYAEAEASLGWLNTSIELTSESSLSPDAWVTQTLEALHAAFAEREMTVAHLKLHLSAAAVPFKASITQMGEPLTWDARGENAITDRARALLNARVNTTPDKLRTTVEQVVGDVCVRLQTRFEYVHFECFSPLPPQPTFRLS